MLPVADVCSGYTQVVLQETLNICVSPKKGTVADSHSRSGSSFVCS
jgi:hypothetical protein